MTLSVAEIRGWDAEAVREVSVGASVRAAALFAGADALAALPAFASWDGRAAADAAEAIGHTRRDLEAVGRQAQAVAEAARRAADGIEALQAELRRLSVQAAVIGWEVHPGANRLMPALDGGSGGPDRHTVLPGLQNRLDWVVEQANSVDAELAAALGDSVEPAAASSSAFWSSSDMLSRPLPPEPRQFRALWQQLSHAERDLLFARDPGIGNRPGMPVGGRGKDHYLRRRLAAELQRARAAGSADLEDLQTLDGVLADNPGIRLMLLDTSGPRLRAAFAAGDPDTATHVSVSTPGLNTTVADSVAAMVGEAIALRHCATRQLTGAAGRSGETVATIGWIGYDAPQIRVRDGLPAMARGAVGVSHDAVAGAAARDLSQFYAGIQGARSVGPAHLTAIGHSYGSLTTGLALQVPGGHAVSDAVFYGSPGIGASAPGDLGLAPGHAFAMAAPDDPIRWVYDGPGMARALAPVIPGPLDDVLLAAAQVSGAGDFGPDPAGNPAFVQLETEAMWGMEAARGHSDYPRAGELGERTSAYNLAAVVAGLEANIIRK